MTRYQRALPEVSPVENAPKDLGENTGGYVQQIITRPFQLNCIPHGTFNLCLQLLQEDVRLVGGLDDQNDRHIASDETSGEEKTNGENEHWINHCTRRNFSKTRVAERSPVAFRHPHKNVARIERP